MVLKTPLAASHAVDAARGSCIAREPEAGQPIRIGVKKDGTPTRQNWSHGKSTRFVGRSSFSLASFLPLQFPETDALAIWSGRDIGTK